MQYEFVQIKSYKTKDRLLLPSVIFEATVYRGSFVTFLKNFVKFTRNQLCWASEFI